MFDKILILSPHTDDGELGAGGSIARFASEGKKIYYAALSTCEDSVPDGLPKNILGEEVKEATKTLGIPPENVYIKHYKVRHLPSHRQEILEELIKIREQINPDLVFTPALGDVHQDHAVVAEESLRVFRYTSILGYELPWNNTNFTTLCFIHLNKNHIERKIDALAQYKSQVKRPYMQNKFMEHLAKVRGVQAKTDYAEAFEVIRWHLK